MKFYTPEHLCRNPWVCIDYRVTGLQPCHNDLVDLRLLPLDGDGNPSRVLMPLHLTFTPKRPENVDLRSSADNRVSKSELKSILEKGTRPSDALYKFEVWYNTLGLAENKRLTPVAWEWYKIYPFLLDFFGYDDNSNAILHHYFNYEPRSIHEWATYLNDVAWCQSLQYPFVFQDLRLARTLTMCNESWEDTKTNRYGFCLNLAKALRSISAINIQGNRHMVDARYIKE